MNKFITTLLCLAGSAILFNANAVEREYTQFTAFNADGSIPNGKYIFAAPTSSGKCRYMKPEAASTKAYGLATNEVSYDSNKHFTGNSDCEFTIQQSNGKYTIIDNNGQYVYHTGSGINAYNLSLNSSNGYEFWSLNTNPAGDSNVSTLGKALCFYNGDRGIKLRNSGGSIEKDFAYCPTSTRGTNPSNSSNYPYPTLYTVVPTLSATANIGGTQTELANGGVLNALVTNVTSGSKVTFNTDGASTLKYSVNGGAEITPSSASFDVNIASATGTTNVTVTATDANGTAYTHTVTINVGNAPCLGEFFQFDENEDDSYDVTLTQSDATGVNLRTYTIDGNSTAADQSNGALHVSNVNLSKARYIVTASNNFWSGQVFEYNFINLLNNALGAGTPPYEAYIVFTNNSDRFTEGYPQSIEIPMTPNSDYTQWTCDFNKILGKSAQELFYYIPWIATEFKIELKIVPRDSDTPMILSGKGMSVAEMPGRNREAAAKIPAQDSSAYSFVVDGGDTLIYKAGLSADGSTFKMIAGSAKFEPFVTNSITLSPYSNIETGISDINPDANEAEYYNLQGIRVDNPQQGIYIRRQGNKTTKVIL